MGSDWDRIEVRNAIPTLRSNGLPLDAVMEALATQGDLTAVAREFSLDVNDMVATLGFHALGEGDSNPLSLTTRHSRKPSRLASVLNEESWASYLPQASRKHRLSLLAGLLQVFDAWEESHEAAQAADDLGERSYSAFWHGIAHRREPDAGNASYWFRRVGDHPIFMVLGETATPFLQAHGDSSLTRKLIASGRWNPFAFIELCDDGRPRASETALAQKLQRLEMKLLLEATAEIVAH